MQFASFITVNVVFEQTKMKTCIEDMGWDQSEPLIPRYVDEGKVIAHVLHVWSQDFLSVIPNFLDRCFP